ncbi:MAG: Glucose-1-phosphate cytidylyltransferase [Phycisphaerae bacterium]|nr:Glucose-1-phosphate cytidylyltransferase [Phycisphaerae bacterium]
MKVVILCGGEGTRLKEETEFRPKPMVPIGNRPILWHIMKLYASQGFSDFVLCLGYRGWDIKEYFLNYRTMNSDFRVQLGFDRAIDFYNQPDAENWTVTLAETGLKTMTGGRIKRIAKYLTPGEDFMVTYGDGLADIDLQELLKFHRSHQRLATLSAVSPHGRFGELNINPQQMIDRFAEKPENEVERRISGGFFIFKYGLLDYLTDDQCVLERAPLEQLAGAGQLMAYQHNGFWQCMDTYREYVELNQAWVNGTAPWAVWQRSAPMLNVELPPPSDAYQPQQLLV